VRLKKKIPEGSQVALPKMYLRHPSTWMHPFIGWSTSSSTLRGCWLAIFHDIRSRNRKQLPARGAYLVSCDKCSPTQRQSTGISRIKDNRDDLRQRRFVLEDNQAVERLRHEQMGDIMASNEKESQVIFDSSAI
jgi:hypothetical protein